MSRRNILSGSVKLEAELASLEAEVATRKLALEAERDPVFGKGFLS